MVTFDKEKTYMELLLNFRRLINEKYVDGGWLPSARQMCKDFDVSSVTYVKAINQLVHEGVANSFPRKGVYIVPAEFRVKKIGIVICDGRESPYVGNQLLQEILSGLSKYNYHAHIIQGSPPSTIARNALTYCVDGIIWLSPYESAFQVMEYIYENNIMPLVAVCQLAPASPEAMVPEQLPVVSEDMRYQSSIKAEFMTRRGHKKIGFIGSKWSADYSGLTEELSSRGCVLSDSLCVSDLFSKRGCLKRMVLKHGVTGLIVSGTARNIDCVMSELFELPDKTSPEIIVTECALLDKIRSRYPSVKLVGVGKSDSCKNLGRASVDMLIKNINNPSKIKAMQMKVYSLEPVRTEKSHPVADGGPAE